MNCESCGDLIVEGPALVASGGWCAPREMAYDLQAPKECSDCKVRMLMIFTLGIDPGRHGKNLRFPRGGIKYNTPNKEN